MLWVKHKQWLSKRTIHISNDTVWGKIFHILYKMCFETKNQMNIQILCEIDFKL